MFLTLSYSLLSGVSINIQLPHLEVIEWLREGNLIFSTDPTVLPKYPKCPWCLIRYCNVLFCLNMKTITFQCSVTVGTVGLKLCCFNTADGSHQANITWLVSMFSSSQHNRQPLQSVYQLYLYLILYLNNVILNVLVL